MAQKSLRNRAVSSILLFLLTGKYSSQKVNMTRKNHDRSPQTKPQHREEGTQNTDNVTCNTISFPIFYTDVKKKRLILK